MIILISLAVVTLVSGLILLFVVKTSRTSRHTSLGSLKSEPTAKGSSARKKRVLSPTETRPKEISTAREVRISPQQEIHVSRQNEEAAYINELRQKLLRKAMGNAATVERLTEYERRLNPTGTLVVWLQAAVDRWEDDHDGRRRW